MNLIDLADRGLFIDAMVGIHIELNEQTHRAPGGHPENARRLGPTTEWLQKQLDSGRFGAVNVSDHSLAPVHKVHSSRYITQLQKACESGGGYFDPETYLTATSFDSAQRVCDAALSAVDSVMRGEFEAAFVLGRPPGHHAEHDHAMGFCLINNVAVAAQYALDTYDIQRVAIVDFDVHHGNGTQHLFYDRSDIYFISTHQYPFYPGTGAASETGAGAGKGFTLNIPMFAGDGDREMLSAFEQQIVPALHRYRPQFMLVSAGFDAHTRDPLGGLNLTGSGFRQIAVALAAVAAEHAEGRIVSLLEGGYNAEGNLDSITNYLDGMDKS